MLGEGQPKRRKVMRIFNQNKTQELFDVDETKGYLINDKLFVRHYDEVKEQGHEEVLAEFENGGKELVWVVDVPAEKERDEFEDILVFVPYDDMTLVKLEIENLKQKLFETDYKAIKFAEGLISEKDYASTKIERQNFRNKINELEQKLAQLGNQNG